MIAYVIDVKKKKKQGSRCFKKTKLISDKSQPRGRMGETMCISKSNLNSFIEKRTNLIICMLLVSLIILIGHAQAEAQILTETIATGGIAVNSRNGVDNLMINPARLSYSGFNIKLGGIGFTFDANNRDFFKFVDEYSEDLSDWANLTVERQDSIRTQLGNLENQKTAFQISPVVGMSFRKFAVAAYATSSLDLELSVPDEEDELLSTEISAIQHTEMVFMAGMSNQVSQRLAFGVNARLINSWENSDVHLDWNKAGNINNWVKFLWQDKLNFTTGYSIGGGVCMTPVKSVFLEYTANNILFHLGDEKRSANSNIQMTAGLSRNNIITRFVSARAIHLASSISSDNDFLPIFDLKKAAAGIEVVYPLLKLRAGINENRYSYGANLNLALFNIGYACQIDGEKSRYHSFEFAFEF